MSFKKNWSYRDRQTNKPTPIKRHYLVTLCSPICSTLIHIQQLLYYLNDNPIKEFSSFVLSGPWKGFHNSSMPDCFHSSMRNHLPSTTNSQIISDYISEELSARQNLFSQLRSFVQCSSFSLVQKSRSTGWWRMIVNPFYFEEKSVNDGTEKHWCSVWGCPVCLSPSWNAWSYKEAWEASLSVSMLHFWKKVPIWLLNTSILSNSSLIVLVPLPLVTKMHSSVLYQQSTFSTSMSCLVVKSYEES